MMKRLFIYLAILLLACYLGLLIHRDPGYMLLAYQQWTVELPLWLAVVLLIIGFVVVQQILVLVRALFSLSWRYRRWRGDHAKHKSQAQTSRGLIEFIEGYWPQAEKRLVKAALDAEAPLINYLSAARSAQAQHAYERRDNYLRLAHSSTPGSEIAVGLTQAELQLKQGQLEQALASLKQLEQLVPDHKLVLKLLKKVYIELHDWRALLAILPRCRQLKIIDKAEKLTLENQAYLALLMQTLKSQSLVELQEFWLTVPKNLMGDDPLLTEYCQALLTYKQDELVEKLLKEALKTQWHKPWVVLYGQVKSAQPAKQLANAETWLKLHPDDSDLLLTLGQLCLQEKLWGKAKAYLETAIQLGRNPRAYLLLGRLYEQQFNEPAKALNYYYQGLAGV